MAKVKIVEDGAVYEVESSNGCDWYTVRYCGFGDADPDYVALWECDCPAGRHGRHCKHIDLIGLLTAWMPLYGIECAINSGWVTGVELVDT